MERLQKRVHLPAPFLVYSTILQGWTDSPLGLTVNLDDHGFHRGDGVFEAVRVVQRRAYLLKEHWDRLQISLKTIQLKLSMDFAEAEKIIQFGLNKFPDADGALRIFVTRGPGGFAADIRESLGTQLFFVLCKFKSQSEERFQKGVRVGKSSIPIKTEWLAQTKSLNYLPNVMMKKESVDLGWDFTVTFDERKHLGESATENLVVLMKDGSLAHPTLNGILKGCTMMRLFDLVEKSALLPTKRGIDISEQDLIQAQGLYMVGTPLDVLPVREFDGHPIPISPWGPKLRDLIRQDQLK